MTKKKDPKSGDTIEKIRAKTKKKHAGGRPSKYPTIDLKEVEKLAGFGLIDTQIADFLDISEKTINVYKKTPKFLQALKRGKVKANLVVEKSLFHRANGYSHKELYITQYKGQIITEEIVKHYPPDPTSMIFWLKNRKREQWADRIDHTNDGSRFDPVQIYLPSNGRTNTDQEAD